MSLAGGGNTTQLIPLPMTTNKLILLHYLKMNENITMYERTAKVRIKKTFKLATEPKKLLEIKGNNKKYD